MLFRNGSDKVKPVWQTDYRYVFRVSMKKSWVRKIQNKLSLNLCCLDCSPKSFNLSFNDRPTFDVVIYMAGYFDSNTWTLYLHSCSVSFGWLKKRRRVHDNNNLLYIVITATVMHHIISCHRTVHDVTSSLRICRLTNGYASEYSFGLSSVFLIYLVVAGTIGLLLWFSCSGV